MNDLNSFVMHSWLINIHSDSIQRKRICFSFFFFSSKSNSFFRSSDGEYLEDHLKIGDLLLIASDGLFHNLYGDLIVQILNNHLVSLISNIFTYLIFFQ